MEANELKMDGKLQPNSWHSVAVRNHSQTQ